jgi:hypothetical protein
VVLRFELGNLVEVVDCQNDLKHDEGHFGFSASATSWQQVLLARFFRLQWWIHPMGKRHRQDWAEGGTYWQYHRAAGQLFDLLGEELDARRNSWIRRKSFSRSSLASGF